MDYKIYMLCGPDGAGKTTIAEHLGKQGWVVKYGGKKENHSLLLMKLNYKAYLFLQKNTNKIVTLIYLYTIFYFLEYFEYYAKVRKAKKNKKNVKIVFDRFYTDRMWKKYIKSRFPLNILDKFYYFVYLKFFPKVGNFIFVLPKAELLYSRRMQDYKTLDNCKKILDGYKSLYKDFKKRGFNVIILNEQDIENNIQTIINWEI